MPPPPAFFVAACCCGGALPQDGRIYPPCALPRSIPPATRSQHLQDGLPLSSSSSPPWRRRRVLIHWPPFPPMSMDSKLESSALSAPERPLPPAPAPWPYPCSADPEMYPPPPPPPAPPAGPKASSTTHAAAESAASGV